MARASRFYPAARPWRAQHNRDVEVSRTRRIRQNDCMPSVRWSEIFSAIEHDTLKDLAQLAKDVCDAPIALVTLLDGGSYWCTAVIGAADVPAIPWELTFCAYAVQQRGVFVVPDAGDDERFVEHPLVCALPGVRFYAGAPLWAGAEAIGTLCVMDTKTRTLAPVAEASLEALARQAVGQLELRRHRVELQRSQLAVETSQAELQRSDRQRRELLANVSHDLRTPLAAVHGYLESVLLKDETLRERSRGDLEQALNLCQGAGFLVSELFELAQLDATPGELRREPLHLAELARDVAQSFAGLTAARGICLTISADPLPAVVDGDPRLLERVLWNLLDNAVRFTPAGGSIAVSCEHRGDEIAVRVRDSGLGILDSDMARIFDRCYRGRQPDHQEKSTAGLGLSISKRIIELHDGTLAADSPAAGGAEFTFLLKRSVSALA